MLILSPSNERIEPSQFSIFLAGSIEMGTAEDWQTQVIKSITDNNVVFLNPRRTDWDSTWKQEITNPQFFEQVTWELDRLGNCDMIFLYLDPKTKSPISLLELGLHAKSNKMIVCCPEGFYRKGNVDIVCKRNSIPIYDNLENAIKALKNLVSLCSDEQSA